MGDQRDNRGDQHGRRPAQEEERDHRHHGADEGAYARGQRRLHGTASRLGPAELLGREHLEHRVGVLGELRRELVREGRVEAFQLIEQRQLVALLVRLLLDLAAFLRHVGGNDLRLGALGEKRASGHGQSRRDGPRQPSSQHEARAPSCSRDACNDAEHGGQPVIGAVDRSRDPTRARAVPGLAAEDPIQPALSAGGRWVAGHMRGLDCVQ